MNYSSHPLIWADSKRIKENYNNLPSELYQYEKLFCRCDKTKAVSKEILDILYSYDVIDTIVLQLLPVHPETIIDDNPISVVYTFNDKNIKKYKKDKRSWLVRTSLRNPTLSLHWSGTFPWIAADYCVNLGKFSNPDANEETITQEESLLLRFGTCKLNAQELSSWKE